MNDDEEKSKKSKLLRNHVLTFKNPMMDLQVKDKVAYGLQNQIN
jgi:hypothetical protein